jgi:hypothetical protein
MILFLSFGCLLDFVVVYIYSFGVSVLKRSIIKEFQHALSDMDRWV